MGPEEFMVAAIAIVGGLALSFFFFAGIFKIVRTWIESRGKANLPVDAVSMKEFIEYKLKTEKRIQTLEAIVVDQDLIDQKKLDAGNREDEFNDEQEKVLKNRLRG
jgi:hypothetical protein